MAQNQPEQGERQLAPAGGYPQGRGSQLGQALAGHGDVVDNEIAAPHLAVLDQVDQCAGAIVDVYGGGKAAPAAQTINRSAGL